MTRADIHRQSTAAGDDEFPTDPATLMACSDAFVAVELWEQAARVGERAVRPGDPDPAVRLEVAWRLWRAGRPEAALALLAGLPDSTHPFLALLRAAAAASRDRTPDALAAVLAEASTTPTGGLTLKIVALTAAEVGDRRVARDAAARYLATVDADDADLRRIMAPAQAAAGDLGAAVASTERACAGRIADPDRPVAQVVAELRDAGHGAVIHRFLAEGFHLTGRLRYGQLLVQLLPRRILHRDIWIIAPMLVAGAAFLGFLGIRPHSALGAIIPMTLFFGGFAVAIGAVWLRAPGASLLQTVRIAKAVYRYRVRSGTASLVLPVLGIGVAGFGVGLLRAPTRTAFQPAPLFAIGLAVLLGGLVAALMLLSGRRRRARLDAERTERVSAEHCRCWERDWFAGPGWRDYLAAHLVPTAADAGSDAVLLRCPATGKAWLHSPAAEVTVRVVLPTQPAPEPQSAAYL